MQQYLRATPQGLAGDNFFEIEGSGTRGPGTVVYKSPFENQIKYTADLDQATAAAPNLE